MRWRSRRHDAPDGGQLGARGRDGPPTSAPAGPRPAPAPPAPRTVDVTSNPDGAEVWEDGALLCVKPCKLAHEPSQELPRQLVFIRGGYDDLEVSFDNIDTPIRGELQARPAPPPKPRPRPKPRPSPDVKPKPIPGLRTER